MYGLEAVTRGSRSLIESNSEAASIYFLDAYNRDDDERNWSFKYLRKQLLLKDVQQSFRKYQARIHHALFVELLTFNLIYNIISLFAYIFLPSQEQDVQDTGVTMGAINTGRWSRSLSFFIQLSIFIAAYKESLFRTPAAKISVACVVLFCMTLGETSTSFYRLCVESPKPIIRHTYYIVLTTTVLLPFPRKMYSSIAGLAVITVDIMISVLSNISFKDSKEFKIVVLCDITFDLTTLAVGLVLRYLIEIMTCRAFLDRRECIESKIKIETERYQEDKFLKSILPKHIAKEVREDIRDVIKNMDQLRITHRPFNKLYVEKYKSVSILYADIVNSMLLAASMEVAQLVETLNDLYGKFDDSAEKKGCMRIKLLGDCYYCVSGIPDKNPRHADNCVQTGLDMIDIIRNVREQRSVNVDMRIGIHSGNILGGLLGLRKWQFDIWSRDVSIASHMEQGGVPGQVHITRATKDNLQDDCYEFLPGNGHLRDAYLQREDIETFLIKPRERPKTRIARPLDCPDSPRFGEGSLFQRQVSSVSQSNVAKLSKRQSSSDSFLPTGRRAPIGSSLKQYKKMVSRVNKILESSIDKMALSKTDQWFSNVGIQPLFLTFREKGRERPFLEQPDPLFKYYLLCMLIIFIGMTIIHVCIMSSTIEFWISYSVLLFLILAVCVTSWSGYIWISCKKDEGDHILDSRILKVSRRVWKTMHMRVAIWLIISLMMLFCSITSLNECFSENFFKRKGDINETYASANKSAIIIVSKQLACKHPWFYTLCAALAMTNTSVFLRMHFLMKLAVNGIGLSLFWYIMDFSGEDIFRHPTSKLADWEEFGFPADQSHCCYLTFVVLILHILDRQVEYICRLDYLTRVKLKDEQEEARSMELVNRMLLFNILPPHVSRYYLNKQIEDDAQRNEVPYHEERSAVAVLFASIPNYAEFHYEDGDNEEGLKCIQLLNEIICGFDLLLGNREFRSVEKIKTIGSTYMAACELQSHENRESITSEEDPVKNVVTLVKFSVAMMSSLRQLNQDAMQDFQLRMGISVGPVMAGVVGTVKPQFDVWGDAVNVASRMDSTGIPGRIHVTKEVADYLLGSECPYECECRGEIFVKGKGMLTTYLVKTPYDEPLIQTTHF